MRFETEILCLRKRIAGHGISLSSVQAEHFRIYLSELVDWNRKLNLTGLSNPKRIVTDLFFDSLISSSLIPHQGKMLDIGSGAGIPGLPIKIIHPELETHLLEPNRKKNSFLKHIIRLLKINNIKVIRGRIERDGDQRLGRDYDLITVRALTDLGTALYWCTPFLKPQGLALFFLGANSKRPIQQARQVIERHNLFIHKQIVYQVPDRNTTRNIVIFQQQSSGI